MDGWTGAFLVARCWGFVMEGMQWSSNKHINQFIFRFVPYHLKTYSPPHHPSPTGFPYLPSSFPISSSQCCPSLDVTSTSCTFSRCKHLKLILYPSGKLLGIVSGEIPQVLQNQCLAVPVLKVYSVRCCFPSRESKAEARMIRPRKPAGER